MKLDNFNRGCVIDVLWLVEHVARELDVACIAKATAANKYNIRIEIRNLYKHIKEYLLEFEPKVVVHPYVYFVKGALATEDIFARWPNAVHVNAAWEQIHYKAHERIKAPSDETAKNGVIHRAWGEFYRKYLIEHGVHDSNIVVSGHPAYQLYSDLYKGYFRTKDELSRHFNLDKNKRWIFVPENYRWAFAKKKIDFFVSIGGDRAELNSLVDFSIPSLKLLLQSCLQASREDSIELIFRPRPAVNTAQMLAFFSSNLGEDTGNIRFIKDGSVREWILASDVVVSSYSTSLLEAAVAGKPAFMFVPIDIPDSLHCEWYDYAPKIKAAEDFLNICRNGAEGEHHLALSVWAQSNLIGSSDVIERLVDDLTEYSKHDFENYLIGDLPQDYLTKKYFNEESHEMDGFSPADVEKLASEWNIHLYKGRNRMVVPSTSTSENCLTNKSMDRDDLLAPDAVKLSNDLNGLIKDIYTQGIAPSSWVGTLPKYPIEKNVRTVLDRLLGRFRLTRKAKYRTDAGEQASLQRGDIQRLDYQPLDNAEDDLRYPWFLYWEIHWVLHFMRSRLLPGMRLLDAGGAASLFTCYMASRGYELHSVDLNEKLLAHGDKVAKKMGWNSMHSYCMDMRKLDFPDGYFDHAFSICVFEHLDYDVKQSALAEIARCLKPGAILSLTFDYRNPAPGVFGIGKDPSPRNAMKTEADIHRSLLATGHFKLLGNPDFQDNQKSYLQHPTYGNIPYTFGAVFLQKM